MTAEFEQVRHELSGALEFELMLGGINVHGTQPIGQYGRRFLARLWREVADTTGVTFGELHSGDYVHNSVLPCLAVLAAARVQPGCEFEVLRKLQSAFFLNGENINDAGTIERVIQAQGLPIHEVRNLMDDSAVQEQLRFQVDAAKRFGTQAMPSLLVQRRGPQAELNLLAGGYVDAAMLKNLLQVGVSATA